MQKSSEHSSSGPSKVSSGSNELESKAWGILAGSDSNHALGDASLFSSSLPVLRHEKLDLNDTEHDFKSVDDASPNLNKLHSNGEVNDVLDDAEICAIGSLLPDDEDELLSGIMDGFDPNEFPVHVDDMEEYDFFGSVGGLELESDQNENPSIGISKMSLSDGIVGNGIVHYGLSNGVGSTTGAHPYGEHPSRTLFVRNINSNVEDSELRALFEQYGDIRTLYTACKHRGFVMISYYDIRAARTAMRALQNKPLRRRKLDIHFSIPKDNPSDKDINQGTLVVFNLDPSVSNDDLRQIFGAYGEIKEIRETPHKRHHKFIEFYDVRAAEAALRYLNRSDIAGKRIKLEPSRPGGARRNLMLQLNQDLDQDESRGFPHQPAFSIANSPPGNWPLFGSPIEHSPLQTLNKSPGFRSLSPTFGNHLPGLASLLHPQATTSAKVPPIGKDHGGGSHVERIFTKGNLEHGATIQQSHSLPESKLSQYSGMVSSFSASSSNGSGIETLSGPQFLWGSPNLFSERSNFSAWQTKHPFTSNGQSHVLPYTGRHGSFLGSAQRLHHVGSAPSDVPINRQFGFHQESPETSFMNPATYGGMLLGKSDRNLALNIGVQGAGFSVPGNMTENGSPGFNMMSSPGLSPIFLGNGHYPGLVPPMMEGAMERGRARVENNRNQIDSKQQFQLDLDKITSAEDARTTLMIKNIPNKYTSKMLLAAIDENHKGTYDFFYLPIDFKNKCNVGYAFINMLSPSHIIPFYQSFNGKKWEKFNSEKIASLAYARIQGKVALINHFQNSSLMNEDKRCRPILFHSANSESGDQIIQEHLSSTGLNIQVLKANESGSEDLLGSPTKDGMTEKREKS